jgi:hypothetical protein
VREDGVGELVLDDRRDQARRDDVPVDVEPDDADRDVVQQGEDPGPAVGRAAAADRRDRPGQLDGEDLDRVETVRGGIGSGAWSRDGRTDAGGADRRVRATGN